MRYGDKELAETLKGYVESIKNRKENARKKAIYESAKKDMEYDIVQVLEEAVELFESIAGYEDSDKKADKCKVRIEELKAEEVRKKEEKHIAAERKKKKAIKITKIVSPIVAMCVVIAILIPTVIIPKAKFNKVMKVVESGDYDNGYDMLEELGCSDVILRSKYDRAMEYIEKGDDDSIYLAYTLLDGLNYQDSEEKKNSIFPQYKDISLKKAGVGSIVYFGSYEQDNDTSNGKENIEWQVLAKEDNKIMVISKYALKGIPYNWRYESNITWETCFLRKWLNETFINSAFSSDEQTLIPETNVSAGNNPEFNTNPGNATKDKIFLLSINEVNKYFSSDDERMCAATDYAKAQGAYISDDDTVGGKGACWWWLRSPGYSQRCAARVDSGGSVDCYGDYVSSDDVGVRPALWITLES